MKRHSIRAFMVVGGLLIPAILCGQAQKNLYRQGIEAGTTGDFSKAAQCFRQALEIDRFAVSSKRGLDLIDDLNHDKVDRQVGILLFKGLVFELKEMPAAAIDLYAKAVELSPDYYFARHNLGGACYEHNENARAEEHLLAASRLNPTYAYTWNGLGLLYNRLKKYADAIKAFEKAIEIDPTYYKAYYNMGCAYQWSGGGPNSEIAQNLFRKALEINPDYLMAAQAIKAAKSPEKAIEFRDEDSTIAELVDFLKYENGATRKKATESIVKRNDPAAIPLLAKLLLDSNPLVRAAVAETLGLMKRAEAVDDLIPILSDSEWLVRNQACTALALIRDERAIEPLLQVLQTDHDHNVRQKAAMVLINFPRPSLVEPLLKVAADDPNLDVRNLVLSTLNSFKWRGVEMKKEILLPYLSRQDPALKVRIVFYLRKTDWKPRTFEEEVYAALTKTDQEQTVFSTWGRKAVPMLTTLLKCDDATAQEVAIRAFGYTGDPQVIDLIVPFLKNRLDILRWKAVKALGNLGAKQTVPDILPLLDDPITEIRCDAAWSLGKFKDPRAIDPLISALSIQIPQIRQAALEALIEITGQDLGPDSAAWTNWRSTTQ